MTDLISKVNDSLSTMSAEERRAYSRGLSHAFAHVFSTFDEAFTKRLDMHAVFMRLYEDWDYVHAAQVVRGVL